MIGTTAGGTWQQDGTSLLGSDSSSYNPDRARSEQHRACLVCGLGCSLISLRLSRPHTWTGVLVQGHHALRSVKGFHICWLPKGAEERGKV